MTLEEFHKIVDERSYKPAVYLVHLRYKYSFEKEWTDSNQLYIFDEYAPIGYYVWENDWHEGQEDVEVLGFIDKDDIVVPDYKECDEK